MSDLVSRVLAAIEETEGIARKATGRGLSPWVADGNKVFLQSRTSGIAVVLRSWPNEVTHIARNDPAAVLRRCAADRELVALHPQDEELGWLCRLCGGEGQNIDCTYPCDTLRLLARGYGISVEEETTGE